MRRGPQACGTAPRGTSPGKPPGPSHLARDIPPCASREQVIAARATAYPTTRRARTSYTGSGYRDGFAKGNQADIGTTRLSHEPRRCLH